MTIRSVFSVPRVTHADLASQSLNIVESPRLRAIFLLLRKELKESDIPGRTTIRKRVEEVLAEHLVQLGEEMKVCNFHSSIIPRIHNIIECRWENFLHK